MVKGSIEEYGRNPGLREVAHHRASLRTEPADEWVVSLKSEGGGYWKKVEEAEEGEEPEGELQNKVSVVGNTDNGTVHAVVKR